MRHPSLALTALILAGAVSSSLIGEARPALATPRTPDISVGIHLLDAPVSRLQDSRARVYIVDHVNPGTTIRRRIVVKNSSQLRRPIAVYPAAAEVTKDEFVFAAGQTPNELTSWVLLDKSSVDLGAGQESTLWVTITVPPNASAGERYAVIWAESSGTSQADATVRNVGRAGIRVYLSVGPGGEPPSDFQISGLTGGRTPEGIPFVVAEVRNTGQRALDLTGELSLAEGPGGLSVAPVKVQAGTLGLGGTSTVRVVLDKQLPDGQWTARLALASGWTRRNIAGGVSFGAVVARPSSPASRVPLIVGITGSTLVLTLLFGYVLYQRSRRQPRSA